MSGHDSEPVNHARYPCMNTPGYAGSAVILQNPSYCVRFQKNHLDRMPVSFIMDSAPTMI